MAPPASSEEIDIHLGPAVFEEVIRRVCRELLTGWLSAGEIHLTQITGGITNVLYKAWVDSAPGVPDPAAIVRVFGDKSDLFIDRTRDLKVLLEMNAQGLGPRLLGTFANGVLLQIATSHPVILRRLERFIEARPLAPEEFADPSVSTRLAVALREMHGVQIAEDRAPRLWASISEWISKAESLTFDDAAKGARFAAVDFARLRAEAAECEAVCSDAVRSPVVFCHNDLLAPNVLVVEGEGGAASGPLHLIDFEYGGYNCRDFDFGNHFNEWAGFDADYTRYPSLAQIRAFIAAYLGRAEAAEGRTPEEELELDALSASALAFSLASHLYWGVWALIQARFSPIDFDFLQYHFLRLGEFRKNKDAWLGAVRRLSPEARKAAGWESAAP